MSDLDLIIVNHHNNKHKILWQSKDVAREETHSVSSFRFTLDLSCLQIGVNGD